MPPKATHFTSPPEGPIYAIHGLPEEVIAVLFAFYSRSPKSVRDNIAQMIEEGHITIPEQAAPGAEGAAEKARKFHEKWVLGYGHASVAEHAVVHVAVENATILMAKIIEDCRLASYTEKSTRYIDFGKCTHHTPASIHGDLKARYDALIADQIALYAEVLAALVGAVRAVNPKPETLSEEGYQRVITAKALDSARYLLPLAMHTSLGITMNAREAAHMINKLSSMGQGESTSIAEGIAKAASAVCPTLLSKTGWKPGMAAFFNSQTLTDAERKAVMQWADHHQFEPGSEAMPTSREDWVTTTLFTKGRIVSVASEVQEWMGRHKSHRDFARLTSHRSSGDADAAAVAELAGVVDDHEGLPRSFESVMAVTSMIVDFGAYRDIQRHRMTTQTLPILSPALGFDPSPLHGSIPPALLGKIEAVQKRATVLYYNMLEAGVPERDCQYHLPLATRMRLQVQWNLREVFHFIRLRSGRAGHDSYRRVAIRMYQQLVKQYPQLQSVLRCDTWMPEDPAIAFERVAEEKRLDTKRGRK